MTHANGMIIAVALALAGLVGWRGAAGAQVATWTAPPEARAIQNPERPTEELMRIARMTFEAYCSVCHGKEGRADGPALAKTGVRPPSFPSSEFQAQTDGEIFWKITNGRGVMPTWAFMSERERWMLVYLIRSFK